MIHLLAKRIRTAASAFYFSRSKISHSLFPGLNQPCRGIMISALITVVLNIKKIRSRRVCDWNWPDISSPVVYRSMSSCKFAQRWQRCGWWTSRSGGVDRLLFRVVTLRFWLWNCQFPCVHSSTTASTAPHRTPVNKCKCPNGVAKTGPDCTTNGALMCSSCSTGYALNAEASACRRKRFSRETVLPSTAMSHPLHWNIYTTRAWTHWLRRGSR